MSKIDDMIRAGATVNLDGTVQDNFNAGFAGKAQDDGSQANQILKDGDYHELDSDGDEDND